MKHYGDITQLSGHTLPIVDVVTGGSPCQDLSVAGRREGLAGERSGLFMEQIRIIKEMRNECIRQLSMRGADDNRGLVRPRYMVWENVPGAFSSNKGEDFRAVLEETAKIADENAVIPGLEGGQRWTPTGCIVGDGWSIAWRVHDAQFWGVPQRRKRICLLADFNGESAGHILFELWRDSDGVLGEPFVLDSGAQSRSEVQSVTKGLSGDTTESGKPGEGVAGDAGLCAPETSWSAISFQERAGKPGGARGSLFKPSEQEPCQHSIINPSVVCIENHPNDSRVSIRKDGTVQTLSGRMGTGGGNVPMVMESTVFPEIAAPRCAQDGRGGFHSQMISNPEENVVLESIGIGNGQLHDAMHPCREVAKTLDCMKDTQKVFTNALCIGNGQADQTRFPEKVGALNCMHDQQAVVTYGIDRAAFNQGKNAQYDFPVTEETISTQVARGPGAVLPWTNSVVRRLTPLECERLQGYPDHWTDIGEWVDSVGKKHKNADSHRYKALGNSIALPFWEWMAKRIAEYYKTTSTQQPTMASLFDGISGFPLVFSRAGFEPVWSSEIEEFPIAVAKRHFPD